MTLARAIERGFTERWSAARNGEQTYRRLKKIAAILGGNRELDTINSKDATKLSRSLERKGMSSSTINRYITHLITLLNLAVKWGELASVPQLPKPSLAPPRERVFTYQEEEVLAELLPDWAEELFLFLLDTGLRVSEALSLTDADVKERAVKVAATRAKNGKPRTIPLTARAERIVRRRCSGGRLWSYTRQHFSRTFTKARKKAGLGPDVVVHTTRHTTATRLLENGADLASVAVVLGHTSTRVTERYLHLTGAHLEEVIRKLE